VRRCTREGDKKSDLRRAAMPPRDEEDAWCLETIKRLRWISAAAGTIAGRVAQAPHLLCRRL
jgi:hypothetical protein